MQVRHRGALKKDLNKRLERNIKATQVLNNITLYFNEYFFNKVPAMWTLVLDLFWRLCILCVCVGGGGRGPDDTRVDGQCIVASSCS